MSGPWSSSALRSRRLVGCGRVGGRRVHSLLATRMPDFQVYFALSTRTACTSHRLSTMGDDSIKKSPRAAFGPTEQKEPDVLWRTPQDDQSEV